MGHQIDVLFVVKSGKEATVYKIRLDGEELALKLYKDPAKRLFQNVNPYLEGKFYRQPSHRRAIKKNSRYGRKLKQENWVKREYHLLEKIFEAGGSVPKPVLQIENAIIMQYIGYNEKFAPALVEFEIENNQAERLWQEIMENIGLFWSLGIVHGDLSAYNILVWEDRPYIIDFPQAVDARTNPEAEELLQRDLENLNRYFKDYLELDLETIYQTITNS